MYVSNSSSAKIWKTLAFNVLMIFSVLNLDILFYWKRSLARPLAIQFRFYISNIKKMLQKKFEAENLIKNYPLYDARVYWILYGCDFVGWFGLLSLDSFASLFSLLLLDSFVHYLIDVFVCWFSFYQLCVYVTSDNANDQYIIKCIEMYTRNIVWLQMDIQIAFLCRVYL